MTAALTRGGRALTAAALTTATAVLLGAAGLVVAGGSGDARAAGGGAVVLDEGETDLAPRVVDGRLRLRIDDRTGGTPVERAPSEVVLHVPPATRQHTPSPLAEAFGLVSQDLWQLNGQQSAGLFALEPGWTGARAGGATEVRLSAFAGPSVFGMADFTAEMENADEPPRVYLGSADPAPRAFTLDADTQRRTPTWLFAAEGVYRLTFTVTGGAGASDTETLAVVVGDDVDPADVLPGDGATPTGSPGTPGTPTGSGGPTGTAPAAHVISKGHLDLAARKSDGDLEFQVKEGTPDDHEWYEPDEVVLHVTPVARRKIPQGYDFLGTPGDPVWWLPMSQHPDIVWPGWSTTEWDKDEIDGRFTYRLDSVRGPGNVALFSDGALGGTEVQINSGDGLPDAMTIAADTHRHTYWAFTAEGVYRTTWSWTATLADGTRVGDTETLAWVVGDDVDPGGVRPGEGSEPSATPTTTPATSTTPTPSATPSASSSEPAASPSVPEAPSGSTTGVPAPSYGSGGAPVNGSLATTGSGAAPLAGTAVAALLLGGAAVFSVRRRQRRRAS
ncbi:surface-anchored protein [Streptomyces sp. SAI-170]|uniref:choice-of-anchor M domain-containing protein n=1 Tax=Streptomyces sp. SAI-170 TaxID=3377729 RepID=UPI003C797C8E